MSGAWAEAVAPLALEGAVFVLALAVLVLGAAGRRAERASRVGWVVAWGLALILGASMTMATTASAFGGAFVVDPLALFVKRVFLGASLVSVVATLAFDRGPWAGRSAEYHFAFLVSLLGMLVLASARELILLFVAFELMSIPLYVMTGFEKRESAASEAALKFFLVGTVSSAVLVYGLSFVYGATGSTDVAAIAPALADGRPLVLLGMALVLAGLGFKIAAVPFHMWVPDAYQVAGTPFVAWLSVAPKAAGFVIMIRLYLESVGPAALSWMPVIATLAATSIVAGNLMAIPQRNVKRLLAYSGIAHIGYMLVGLAAVSADGVATLLFYLIAYLFGNMGAFFVVQAVGASERSDGIDAYGGLAQRSPVLALAMLVFLLSLGGIPFVAGFWAKLFVFWAAVEQGLYWLVFLGAVLTVVALYYYLLIARRMYIDAPTTPERVPVPRPVAVAIGVCALGVVVMGVYPTPWLDAAMRVASTLF